ncbi:hypothetical protein GCM10011581_33080 [Saccharopolyspora subtropica]|uniref:Uncharacterized protein n=1 Tax=Saccharopolyspora thermophila TaxID=89367 RepID=A0A917NEM7_9PSEU|nr:hypothetical protein [Saccharopolyspora subtropica]GGI93386.1 hypothetical protein GCM10011581_33080 [Saccharopolyspora subtropica]
MDGIWVHVLVAFVAGASGAGVMSAVISTRSRRTAPPSPAAQPVPAQVPDQWWHDVQRCEQAVYRAARAVEAVSSEQARHGLQTVVRRMDAELPNVRALAEVGRGVAVGSSRDEAVLRRLQGQLDDAAARFGMVTDHVLEVVVQLVADPDLSRVHEQVTVLREQFPLLRPMSAVFGPEPGSAPARALQRAA